VRCGEKDLSHKECYPYPPPPWVSDDPDCSPLFERAVWFIPLDGLRAFGPDPEWDKMRYWVRVDDATGLWRIAGGIEANDCSGEDQYPQIQAQGFFTSPRECIRIVKPAHRKQYVNLEKDQAETDECGLNLPEDHGELTCVVVEIDPQVVPRTMAVEIWTQDPPYEPPEGDAEPTNPGVASDFGNRRAAGADNRGLAGGTPCPPGRQCFVCRAAPPQRQLACKRVGIWRDGDRFISAVQLNTGTYGGDNFTVHAVRIPSPSAENWASCTAVHSRGPVTVWRKLWMRVDWMKDETSHRDETNDYDKVQGALADGFYEIARVGPYDAFPHWGILSPEEDDDVCGPGVPQSTDFTPLKYAHFAVPLSQDYHSPPNNWNTPSHSMSLIGSHRIKTCYNALVSTDIYGLYCPNDSHSWIAEDCIRKAYDPESEYCHYGGEGPPPIDLETLRWRIAVHEVGHNIGFGEGPFDDLCGHPPHPLDCDQRQPSNYCNGVCDDNHDGLYDESIMDYDCLFDPAFPGFFSMQGIQRLRLGVGVRQ